MIEKTAIPLSLMCIVYPPIFNIYCSMFYHFININIIFQLFIIIIMIQNDARNFKQRWGKVIKSKS